MLINYTQERDVSGNQYFTQYKNWSNMASLWKKFWSVKFHVEDDKVKQIDFRVLDFTTIPDFEQTLAMVVYYFPEYTCYYRRWREYMDRWEKKILPTMPTVELTPKNETPFIEVPQSLQDKRTERMVTDKELAKMSASDWFVTYN